MSLLTRKKSKSQQATDWLTTALKLGAVVSAARGAKKATKAGAKKGAKKAAKSGGKGLGKRLAPIAAIGGLIVVAKKLRSSKYLNNLIEQYHRGVKQRIAPRRRGHHRARRKPRRCPGR